MKAKFKWRHHTTTFLSDLCGREVHIVPRVVGSGFLSDLCGREDAEIVQYQHQHFLSDLCGREDAQRRLMH